MESTDRLVRGIGLAQATALNMIDMIGVGPFITIPLMVATMHGPQAMLGWVLGALLVVCDGMVWAELGAAMPQAGGPFATCARCIPDARAAGCRFSSSGSSRSARRSRWRRAASASRNTPATCGRRCADDRVAQDAASRSPASARRRSNSRSPTARSSRWASRRSRCCCSTAASRSSDGWRASSGSASSATTLWIIVSGVTHFSAAQAFTFPPGAWALTPDFFTGLGAALLIAVYDYWGYYNVCYLGAEIRDPARDIPRAILLSIAGVAAHVSDDEHLDPRVDAVAGGREVEFIASDFMARIWGPRAGVIVTVLMLWTAFASVFSLLLGYSRVPVRGGASTETTFPCSHVFTRSISFPHVSLLVLGGAAIVFCLFRLADVVTALVVIRIMTQFLAQTLGIIVLRTHTARFSAAVQDVAVSVAGAAGVRRLRLHGRDAAEVDPIDRAGRDRRGRRNGAVPDPTGPKACLDDCVSDVGIRARQRADAAARLQRRPSCESPRARHGRASTTPAIRRGRVPSPPAPVRHAFADIPQTGAH